MEKVKPERPPRVDKLYPNLATIYELLGKHETWRQSAQCRIEEVDIVEFFPWRGTSQAPAKDVCSRCSVVQQCQDFAIENEMRGIWAGEIRH